MTGREYFNHRTYLAETAWERRNFLQSWWRLNSADPRWIPPYYPALRSIVHPQRNPYLASLAPQHIFLEAMQRRRSQNGSGTGYATALLEEPTGTALLLFDRRRRDGTAYASLLHSANDTNSLERLFTVMAEQLWQRGFRRIIGPTGLTPHLQSGLLRSHFHLDPSLHTPYTPPYLPEIMGVTMDPLLDMHLYQLSVPGAPEPLPRAPAQLTPLLARRLARSLHPLMVAACEPCDCFPAPSRDEVALMLEQLGFAPRVGWLARVDRQPVGFVLMQPDVGGVLRRARGGRTVLRHTWLRWRSRHGARTGRLLFGGVLPAWRGRGIGRQLIRAALHTARQQGWHALTVGPLPADIPATALLAEYGATPQQRYTIYSTEL